jgi:hypothetical protein
MQSLHREESANIIIFISHHTKDSWIIEEIRGFLSTLYNDLSEATLSTKSLGFMNEFMSSIPELVLENREVAKERKRMRPLKMLLKDQKMTTTVSK